MNDRTTLPPGEDISDFLAQFSGSEVYYCANPGNGGDSLIAVGAFQRFREAGIRCRLIRFDDEIDLTGKTVFYAGGGNLIPLYRECRTFLRRHHRSVERLVLLPHSIDGHEELLGELGDNVDLIAREKRSFRHIERHAPGARRHLMHDLAISLDLEELRANPWAPQALTMPRPREAARLVRHYARRMRLKLPPEPVLNNFRTDGERLGSDRPEGAVDLPEVLKAGTAPEFIARRTAIDLLDAIDRYQEVHTDRLHIAIGAALLGKKVVAHDNSYGKVRSIWEHSLKDRFPNVEWSQAA